MLKYLWFGYLIPWITVSEQILDDNYNPILYSGREAGGFKGDYVEFQWFGLVAGYIRNGRVIELSDTELYVSDMICPQCESQFLLANKIGNLVCQACEYKGSIFEESFNNIKE